MGNMYEMIVPQWSTCMLFITKNRVWEGGHEIKMANTTN